MERSLRQWVLSAGWVKERVCEVYKRKFCRLFSSHVLWSVGLWYVGSVPSQRTTGLLVDSAREL